MRTVERHTIRKVGQAVLAVATATVLSVVAMSPAQAGAQAADRSARPTAAVSMGDSAISGEGGGSYEPGTNGPVDFCHRSANATIHNTAIPGIAKTVNLACSGADSSNLIAGQPGHYGEASEADQLATVANTYNVKTIVVQVGANDDPAFADSILECIKQWAQPGPTGCRNTVGATWSQRVAAMAPKVEAALASIRTVMRTAGYADTDYSLVLNSYASPVTENMSKLLHAAEGCPLKIEDARWGRTVAVPQLNTALAGVAQRAGVKFLDLSRATEGREACNKSVPKSARWQNPLTTKISNVIYGVNLHLVQESFHPNANGYRAIGGCVGEFVVSGAQSAACLIGPDGRLHPSGPAANSV